MSIIVAGGGGFIGINLVKELLKNSLVVCGREIVTFTSSKSNLARD